MNIEELQQLVARGESELVEFKSTTGQRSEAMKAVCAMLNGAGGFVCFGISDDGSIRGQDVSTRTLEQLTGLFSKFEPSVGIQPEVLDLNGSSVIVVRVPEDRTGPFTYDGRPYVREGPITRVMRREQYRRLMLEEMNPANRWEAQPAQGVSIADLDHAEIRRTVEEAIRRGRIEDPGTRDPEELLRGLRLIRDGTLLNAAVVLFAIEQIVPARYPQCLLRLARFRGTSTAEFEDNRQVHGNAFGLLQQAQRFLREHLPVAGRVEPQLFERKDEPLYPPEALREALANALCHREYESSGGSVSIGIFDDRLEIGSTGYLPHGLTVEDLTEPHTSKPRNPLIAGVFYRRGLIEQWGRGTLRMAELTQEAGLAPPEFEERGGEMTVRFFPTRYVAPRRVDHPLTDLQQEVLQVVGQIGPARLSEIIEAIDSDASERQVQHTLQTLKSIELVQLEGYGRGAKWGIPQS